jgi:hypothetical protein
MAQPYPESWKHKVFGTKKGTYKLFESQGQLINLAKEYKRKVMREQGFKTGKQYRKYIKKLRAARRQWDEKHIITHI